MIKSMTGFSSKSLETERFTATVEVKSLNSKFLDLSIRMPKGLSENESEVRNLATSILVRGKVSIGIEFQSKNYTVSRLKYNSELFKQYYEELKNLAGSVAANEDDLFRTALQSPDVAIAEEDNETVLHSWNSMSKLITETLEGCNKFRIKEGANMQKQIEDSVDIISKCKSSIGEMDPKRIEKARDRIKSQLEELVEKDNIDENRFEQELIYYIEKLDISEELVRLASHLQYFDEVLHQESCNGKKLGFISQEIGREINTIGSKANDAGIQKLVIQMKDELEKIKEQGLNVL
jgi:uncharacterized protein (TIGR00255 family)